MENTSLDVVVIGNAGIDTNIYLPGQDINFEVEGNFTENLDYVGQAGGYAARGYAQLGQKTAFIGAVGNDFSGEFIRQELAGDGIDLSAVFVDPAGTSRSINFMYQDGRRKNFYDGKSHMSLQPDLSLAEAVLARARLAHFNIPNWARRLLPAAKKYGLTIACDIQDVVWAEDPYRYDFVVNADILFFSAANHGHPGPLIEIFLRLNPRLIVIAGMGAQGCVLGRMSAEIQFFPPPALNWPVIDTNGAGDSLAVGFLTSYALEGCSLKDSIRRGQIAARHACTEKASSSHLITPAQLERYFISG